MSTAQTFNPQVLGQTEKALNAILMRLLAGPGLTEHQWITLSLAVAGGGTVDTDELAGRVAGGLKVSPREAQSRIEELVSATLLRFPDGERSPVKVTDTGQALFTRIRGEVSRITERLWGDLPADDLETAGRVLATILARVDTELAVI
jgi:DNA-binding MarR family transcriptional regulator